MTSVRYLKQNKARQIAAAVICTRTTDLFATSGRLESNWRSGGREISKAAIFLSGARAPNCSYPTSQNRELGCQKSRLHQTARQNDVACIVYRMRDNNSLRPHLKMHSGEKSTSVIDPTSVRRPTCSRLLDKTV